jgi:signal transduction histidine kinase
VFQVLERQVGMLVQLVNDLLEVSRVTTGKVRLKVSDCDVTALVQRAVDTTRPGAEARGHHLSLSMPESAVWVHADAMRVEQVLVNLLTNAIKYTPEGGNIWLTVEQDLGDAVVRVKDSGMGIEPNLRPYLFDLFSQGVGTLDRSDSGLGIGLALAKSLIEMHGGTVTAISEGPGKGSEFVVRLPALVSASPGAESRAVAIETPLTHYGTTPLRVLLVDDSVDMISVFALLLRSSGHEA